MKPTHGSDFVCGGGLKGGTDTDYFYFICPRCPDEYMLRILDFEVLLDESGSRYNDKCHSKAKRRFTIRFELFCEQCRLHDCVKVSNDGWQGGKYSLAARKPESAGERAV